MITKLGVMAGLDQLPPDASIGGVGGLSSLETQAPQAGPDSLRKMETSVSLLTERSKALAEFYKDRGSLLAATPSVWPVRGYLSAGFGNRIDPFTGQRDFHAGIDISTPTGTRVLAPADGLVVSCGVKGGYGNAAVIDHGFGVVTRYAHLDHFNVKPGQRVHRGDVIAFVGNTGRSTAPHLHYEVWVNDQAQNPIQYILDEYRSFG
jgi:murein DD-endopeptidase MepM/ murein hydrolase activator NlpD